MIEVYINDEFYTAVVNQMSAEAYVMREYDDCQILEESWIDGNYRVKVAEKTQNV